MCSLSWGQLNSPPQGLWSQRCLQSMLSPTGCSFRSCAAPFQGSAGGRHWKGSSAHHSHTWGCFLTHPPPGGGPAPHCSRGCRGAMARDPPQGLGGLQLLSAPSHPSGCPLGLPLPGGHVGWCQHHPDGTWHTGGIPCAEAPQAWRDGQAGPVAGWLPTSHWEPGCVALPGPCRGSDGIRSPLCSPPGALGSASRASTQTALGWYLPRRLPANLLRPVPAPPACPSLPVGRGGGGSCELGTALEGA